ncbi:tyrosine-type recombinase/integrase [Thermodesulfobacteriota bacterium]
MANNAKVYERKDRGVFYVQLYWKGKQYRRFHYNEEINLVHKTLADQIASAINADIKKKNKNFDPRQRFRTPGYEFQFDLFAGNWLSDQTHYAPSVIRDVHRYVGYFTDFFNKTDIREIRKADIKVLIKWLPNHLSPKTKANILGLFHKMMADANDDELLERLPGFPKIEVSEPEIKWIPAEWQDKIIAEIPEGDRPIFVFIRSWGFRPGEARALMWDSVDFEKEVITIKRTFSGAGCNHLREFTKTKRIRYLPFTDELRVTFNSIRGLGGFVFRNRQGRPYTADISRIWKEAKKACKCPYDSTLYQDTRHSFATQHTDKLDLVRQVLGHTRTDMTRRYQGLNLGPIKEMLK